MSRFKRIAKNIREEIAKVRQMSPKDALDHIWTYYKLPILGGIFVIIFIVSLLSAVLNPEETYLQNAYIRLYSIEESAPRALTEDFHEALELGPNDTVTTRAVYRSALEGSQEDIYSLQTVQLLIAAKELDLLFLDRTSLEEMANMDFYSDLEAILPAELWAEVKDRAVYLTDPDTGKEYAAALDVTDHPIIESCNFSSDSVLVSIASTTQRAEHCIKMLEYIFGWSE